MYIHSAGANFVPRTCKSAFAVKNSQKNNPSSITCVSILVRKANECEFEKISSTWMRDGKPLENPPVEKFDKKKAPENATEKVVITAEYIKKPDGAEDETASAVKIGNEEWMVSNYHAVRYYCNKPVTEVKDCREQNSYKTDIRLFPAAKLEEANRSIYIPSYRLEKLLKNPEERKKLLEGDEELKKHTWEKQIEIDASRPVRRLLEGRYGSRRNLSIVELGPYCSTWVPRALIKEGNGNYYYGLDVSMAGLDKQREFLAEEGKNMIAHTRQVWGCLYKMPFEPGSADLVVAAASFPLFSPEKDVKDAIDETFRALKRNGEFVLDAGSVELMAPKAVSYLMQKFNLVFSHGAGIGRILVLRKKS